MAASLVPGAAGCHLRRSRAELPHAWLPDDSGAQLAAMTVGPDGMAPRTEPVGANENFRPALQAEVQRRWLEGPAVVLIGAAGVGKSWLASAAAHASKASGAVSRVWTVPVAGPSDAWPGLLARVMGAEVPTEATALFRWLDRHGPSLVCLDAVVADPSAPAFVDELVAAAPSCRVLLTSRRAFPTWGVPHIEVPPMANPEGEGLTGPAADYLRMRLDQLGLPPNDEPMLAALLRELEGIPLAIDLALPRLRVMAPAALMHRLRKGHSMLAQGTTSFDAVVDMSWRVLDDEARAGLVSLSVASSPMSMSTAEALLGGRATARLQALADDGWLRRSPDGLHLLRCLARVIRRRAGDETLARVESDLVHAVHGRDDPEARRQRTHALALAAQRPRLTRTHAEAVLMATRAEDGPLIDDGFMPWALPTSSAVDAILEASRDSGADVRAFIDAWLTRTKLDTRRGDWSRAETGLRRAVEVASVAGGAEVEGLLALAGAELALARGDAEGASDLAGSARDRVGAGARELQAVAVLAAAQEMLGDPPTAIALWRRLVAQCHRPEWADAARLRCAWCLLDEGEHDEARTLLAAMSTDAPSRQVLEALLAHDTGDLATAERAYRHLMAGASGVVELMAWVGWGMLRLGAGSRPEASAAFRDARGLASSLHRADWARLALALELRADAELPEAFRTRAVELPGGPCRTRADRLAEALREEREGTGVLARLMKAERATPTTWPEEALVIGAEGDWFRLPHGEVVSLANRPTVGRVLVALAEQRRTGSGQPMAVDALLASAWPDERVRADAGAHRVRVAVSTLRKLGLRTYLETVRGGYRLVPTCPLVVTPD